MTQEGSKSVNPVSAVLSMLGLHIAGVALTPEERRCRSLERLDEAPASIRALYHSHEDSLVSSILYMVGLNDGDANLIPADELAEKVAIAERLIQREYALRLEMLKSGTPTRK